VPYVLTVDQIDSRLGVDRVDPMLSRLAGLSTVLPFTRTVGDEFQGLLDQEASVVDAILLLMRDAHWHIGLGIGSVQTPLTTTDPRAARGDAFLAARAAVDRAKVEPSQLAVASVDVASPEVADVETVFRLLEALRNKRTDSGWQAVDLLAAGHTQAEAAAQLHISRQAVGQRVQAAQWTLEQAAEPTLARLLDRADRAVS
jgi:hypothetical protein